MSLLCSIAAHTKSEVKKVLATWHQQWYYHVVALIAQSVEHLAVNQGVTGSSPV